MAGSITPSVKTDADESGACVVTLSVTNLLNDTYAADITVATQTSGPVLRLTTDKVTLKVGDSFSFFDYIAAAEDENGNSLFRSISMNGSVDTSTPGTYTLEFYCTDDNGVPSPTKTLTVVVE